MREQGTKPKRLSQPCCKIWLPLVSSSSYPIESWGHFSALCFQKATEKLLNQGSTKLGPKLLFRAHRISLIYFKATETLEKFPPSCFPLNPNNEYKTVLDFKTKRQHQTSDPFNLLKSKMHESGYVTWIQAFLSVQYKSTWHFSLHFYVPLQLVRAKSN